ncbi:GDSL Lipase/Acylhydrolase family protein [Aulographum hederae CBS 113979]|uniref:GDSL Lipase/Acylhydrolase family protein n=1 Tax=Aulographum hederae CBS 113979 TaxID=1176131 RepID=A0A6G1GK22_9PEZI|nr:GDSL Lipase/Acylhydrolase family protein [Aulographum hederae CBS 113979]
MQDIFFLFGDSITQHGYNQDRGFGWTAQLSEAYIRRLTVVNAGLSGYNSDQALIQLPALIPSPSHGVIRIMTVFFGANDSRLPDTIGTPQHVPLDRYKENLRKIVTHTLVRAHRPRIILITSPPIDEELCEAHDLSNGIDQVRRRAAVTRTYADAVKEVGKATDVVVFDLWSLFMERVGWKEGMPLAGEKSTHASQQSGLPTLLRDGLHLTPDGNRIVFEGLLRLIQRTWPDQSPDSLDFTVPKWDDPRSWTNP